MNLLAYLLAINLENLPQTNPKLLGQLIENFVAVELVKQLTFSQIQASLHNYRSASGQEIDFILEGAQKQLVAIEVKSRSRVDPKDFIHLEDFKHELGKRFQLYQGHDIASLSVKNCRLFHCLSYGRKCI